MKKFPFGVFYYNMIEAEKKTAIFAVYFKTIDN